MFTTLTIFQYTVQSHYTYSHSHPDCYTTITTTHFENIFICPNWNSVLIKHQLLIPPPSQALATTILPSVSMNLTLTGTSYKWKHTVIFHCMYTSHFVYLFIHIWTFGLLPPFGYCEHRCTIICSSPSFHCFWVNIQ